MTTRRQNNFASGEISPAFAARTDSSKWHTGLRTLRNCHLLKPGGFQNRGGFEYMMPSGENSDQSRLVPFVNSRDNSFLLEFGDKYIRAMNNGSVVTNDTAVITGATQANPCVLTLFFPWGHGNYYENTGATTMTATGASWAVGDLVTLTASASFFETRFIGPGNYIRLVGEAIVLIEITIRTSATIVTGTIHSISSGSSVPASMRAAAISNWDRLNTTNMNRSGRISISGVAGMTQLNGNTYDFSNNSGTVTVATGIGFTIQASIIVDSSAFTAFSTSSYGIATRNKTPTAITAANPPVVTMTGHNLEDGQEVVVSDVGGMTELNGRHFLVSASTDDTFSLQDLNGTNINASSYTAFTSGGTFERVLRLQGLAYFTGLANFSGDYGATALGGIAIADVDEIRYAQRSNQSLIVSHADYPPMDVVLKTYYGYNHLVLRAFAGQPNTSSRLDEGVSTPIAGSISGGAGGVTSYYRTTGLSADGEEGSYVQETSTHTASLANPVTLTLGTFTNRVIAVNIYKSLNGPGGPFGWIGVSDGAASTFIDYGTAPNYDILSPDVGVDIDNVEGSDDNFSVVESFQQRLFLAKSNNSPNIIVGSEVHFPWNFLVKYPATDSTAIVARLAGGLSSGIMHLVSAGRLFILTDSHERYCEGKDGGAILTAQAFGAHIVDYNGANLARPVVAQGNVIFIDGSGYVVRALSSENPRNGSLDLTPFSTHLFHRYTISQLAWQSDPNAIIWCVRSDGKLLGLTYMPLYEVFGWHRHDTDGSFKDVVSVIESGRQRVYTLVERTINGATVKYIERLYEREVITDIEDAKFMDSWASYDGENETTSHTMTLSGGSTWASGETGLTLTSSASYFTSADVGNAIVLQDSSGRRVKCTITAYTSGTVVTVTTGGFSNDPEVDPPTAFTTVPTSLRSTAVSTWGKAVDDVSGLWHLIGENVTVIADGNVLHNPNDSTLSTKTVSATGTITLASTYVKIHVGLPYISDAETLELDTPNRSKLMGKVTVQCEYTRGVYAGRALPADSSPLTNMQPMSIYNSDVTTRTPLTGRKDVVITSQWDFFGRVALRQVDPLPMTILSILPEGMYPPKG